MKKEKNNNWWIWVVVLIILVFVILIYFGTFGKVDYTKEFRESKEKLRVKWIDKRITKLSNQIKKKRGLKETLDRFVAKVYFATRLAIILIYLVINGFLFYYKDLDTVLNINQATFILFLAMSFVVFDKPSDVFKTMKRLRLKIQRMVYREYIRHIDSIDRQSNEIKQLELERDKLNQQINNLNNTEN
jgi:cell division protein FtsB